MDKLPETDTKTVDSKNSKADSKSTSQTVLDEKTLAQKKISQQESTEQESAQHPIRNRNFINLLVTQLFAQLSTGFFEIPIMWWLIETTGSGQIVATVAFIASIAYLVGSPYGGVLADKGSKKILSTSMFLVDAVFTSLVAILLIVGNLNLITILVLLAITNLATALRGPALNSLLPLTVAKVQYQQANATMGLATQFAALASMAVAGIATAILGVSGALFTGVGLLLLATIFMQFYKEPRVVAAPEEQSEPPEDLLKNTELNQHSDVVHDVVTRKQKSAFRIGLDAVFTNPLILAIVTTTTLLNFTLAPMTVLFAPFAKSLNLTATGFGLFGASLVAGQILGLALLNVLKINHPLRMLVLGNLGIALGLFTLSFATQLWMALIPCGLMGFSASLMTIQLQVIFQNHIAPEVLGRASGILGALSMAAQPLGLILTGVLLGIYAPQRIFVLMAIIITVASLLWLRSSIRYHFNHQEA